MLDRCAAKCKKPHRRLLLAPAIVARSWQRSSVLCGYVSDGRTRLLLRLLNSRPSSCPCSITVSCTSLNLRPREHRIQPTACGLFVSRATASSPMPHLAPRTAFGFSSVVFGKSFRSTLCGLLKFPKSVGATGSFDAVWQLCMTTVHRIDFELATLLSPKWTKSRLTQCPNPSYGITFRCTGADSVARRGGSLRDCTAPPLHYVRPVIVFVIRSEP